LCWLGSVSLWSEVIACFVYIAEYPKKIHQSSQVWAIAGVDSRLKTGAKV
jgi:hypothetical protein